MKNVAGHYLHLNFLNQDIMYQTFDLFSVFCKKSWNVGQISNKKDIRSYFLLKWV